MSRSGGASSASAARSAAGPRTAAAAPRRMKSRRETVKRRLVMMHSSKGNGPSPKRERGKLVPRSRFGLGRLSLLRQPPQPHGLVEAAGQAVLALRGDRHAPDPVGVAEEAAHLLAALHVPQPHGVVVTAR